MIPMSWTEAVPLLEAAKEFEVNSSPTEQEPGLSAPHKGLHTHPNMMQKQPGEENIL